MVAVCGAHAQETAAKLAPGFVHLRSIESRIIQAIRYAGPENFTGKTVPGYEAAECIIVERAALALQRAQAALKPKGLGLKVFDCYRPATAVAAFVRWATSNENQPELRRRYYPNYARRDLFPRYIAKRSGHSRGGTVDLTLINLSKADQLQQPLQDGCGPHEGGAELDMGTGFDCFHTRSRTASRQISANARKNRQTLVQIMQQHGFRNYAGEWWHFTLTNEPYRRTYFDFPVIASGSGGQ